MDELVAFLRAALDRDEQVITAACLHIDDCNDSGIADLFDEDRMLAEVKAKRRLLDVRRRQIEDDDPAVYLAGDIIPKLLVQPYAGQPGWREEWQLSAPT